MILQLCDASAIGGIETHIETLAKAQHANGHDVAIHFIKDYGEGDLQNRFAKTGIQTSYGTGRFIDLFNYLRNLAPSIIHSHGYKANIWARIACPMLKIPIISTFHAGERAPFPVNIYQFIDELTAGFGGRIAVSKDIARRQIFKTPDVKNFIFPIPKFQNAPEQIRFIFAGRMSYEKGPDLFCQLAKDAPSASQWHAFGNGPMFEELKTAHARHLQFHGFCNNSDEIFNDVSALVMPSRNEGLPMVALEAMARGIPVIASATGALPDLITNGENGFLFHVEDMENARQRLKSFCTLSLHQRQRMGENARKTIVNDYSTLKILPEIFKLYDQAGYQKPL